MCFITLIACNQSKVKKMDAIVLDSIKAFDNNIISFDTNYKTIFALLKSERNDTTEIEILTISSLMEIKYYKLLYLYLGYKNMIFSNYPFLHPENENQFEYIIKKTFPEEYNFSKYHKSVFLHNLDERIPVLVFYKDSLIEKRYKY
jgi:hypothetical protein